MHDMDFSSSLKVIARAGAGVNNIPLDKCAEKGIVVFNTPGANANGVKELVFAGMLYASRDIVGGIEWVEKQGNASDIGKLAEKQKKQFAGCEISGKKLGIIGLGASAYWLPTQQPIWGWRCMDMILISQWTPPGTCPGPFTTLMIWKRFTGSVIISPFMYL